MKKKSIKNLSLKKVSICNLATEIILGGREIGPPPLTKPACTDLCATATGCPSALPPCAASSIC